MGTDLYLNGEDVFDFPLRGTLRSGLIGPVRMLTKQDITREIEKLTKMYTDGTSKFDKCEIATAISAFSYALNYCTTIFSDEDLRECYIAVDLCKIDYTLFRGNEQDDMYGFGYGRNPPTKEQIEKMKIDREKEEKRYQEFKNNLPKEGCVFFGSS